LQRTSTTTHLAPPYRTVTLPSPSSDGGSSNSSSSMGTNPLYSAHCMHWFCARLLTMDSAINPIVLGIGSVLGFRQKFALDECYWDSCSC
jgi:hypothetical protein